jgi:hypothetical protein
MGVEVEVIVATMARNRELSVSRNFVYVYIMTVILL